MSELIVSEGAAPGRGIRGLVAGFGLPGRAVAEVFEERGWAYSVVELNEEVVKRCLRTGHHMVSGDARREEVLREAGVMTAELVAVMIPSDSVVLQVVEVVRRLRPDVKILARATFTSAGMEMVRRGATEIVVAEQVVAAEAGRRLAGLL